MYPPEDPYGEYIDGLHVKKDPPGFRVGKPRSPWRGDIPPVPTSVPYRARLTRAIGCGTLLVLALVAICCCGGWVFIRTLARPTEANAHSPTTQVETVAPQPSTVTVTVTTASLPESCRIAIQQMLSVIDSASALASLSSKQLDILSEAYQAILKGDLQRINEVADIQRQLERDFGHDQVVVQTPYEQIKNGIATCPA